MHYFLNRLYVYVTNVMRYLVIQYMVRSTLKLEIKMSISLKAIKIYITEIAFLPLLFLM